MDVGTMLLDADRNVEFATLRAAQLLGCATLENLRTQWSMLRPHFDWVLAKDVKEGICECEVPLPPPAYGLFCTMFPMNGPALGGRVLLQLEDATAREADRTNAIQATQLRTLGCLSRALSHDIRGGLNGIVINLKVIEQMAATGRLVGEEGRSKEILYREAMGRSVAQMKDSLEALLAQVLLVVTPHARFDLSQLAVEVARATRPTAIARRITLVEPKPPGLIPVSASQSEVKQAALNIMVNAFEFVPAGGTISIDVQIRDGHAVLSIADTGPGIAAEIMPRIGQPNCSTKSGSAGMGLYVARTILDAYGGQLEVRSELGTGTCIDLILPLSSEGV